MSVDQMKAAAQNTNAGDCPSESLYEEGGQSLTAWDDISGQQLETKLMVAARKEEIKYFQEMGVYDKVDVSEAWTETGKAPIAVRWVAPFVNAPVYSATLRSTHSSARQTDSHALQTKLAALNDDGPMLPHRMSATRSVSETTA